MRALVHLRELEESLKDWQRYQSISLEDLKRERDKRNMVLHAMFVSIQAAIDVATYLIAEEGLGKPVTYRETFEIMGRDEMIPAKLAEDLSNLAGFRNVLVHIYWQL
ncbi:MAG: type VII toxin-antitoxin system HepT family RNase toxin [Methanosarcina sp.]